MPSDRWWRCPRVGRGRDRQDRTRDGWRPARSPRRGRWRRQRCRQPRRRRRLAQRWPSGSAAGAAGRGARGRGRRGWEAWGPNIQRAGPVGPARCLQYPIIRMSVRRILLALLNLPIRGALGVVGVVRLDPERLQRLADALAALQAVENRLGGDSWVLVDEVLGGTL